MKRRPRESDKLAIPDKKSLSPVTEGDIGIVLSGGGARAAYQVGALKALIPYLKKESNPIGVIVGSSIGAINGLLVSACLDQGIDYAVSIIEDLWRERNFRNTFSGSPSRAFFRAIKLAVIQYMAPGPDPTSDAVFDPSPLMQKVDSVLRSHGGLSPENRHPKLKSVAVMTTKEGIKERKPLLFLSSHTDIDNELLKGASFEVYRVDELHAVHGFASAALPSVLPPVEIDTDDGKIRLVDGGIAQNVPVDPCVRLGASRVILVDVSGRDWWLDRYNESHDTRPSWEIPAGYETFCIRPPDTFVIRCQKPLGPVLKEAVSGSTRKFIAAVGPTWPVFSLLKNKLGEDVAYETMTYVALDQDYLRLLIEQGYNETIQLLRNKKEPAFHQHKTMEEVVEAVSQPLEPQKS
ncbi:MAG: patatin-like phospholipase family protein [Bdellovibrionales bacterium]|nr:patatin-like phospholipase family protein [Bdellovibrionales bacterium]